MVKNAHYLQKRRCRSWGDTAEPGPTQTTVAKSRKAAFALQQATTQELEKTGYAPPAKFRVEFAVVDERGLQAGL